MKFIVVWASLMAQMVKRLPAMWETWVRKIPWRRKWQPAPVLLSVKSHGQRSLVGYSPWGRKELDTTKRLHFLSLSLEILILWSTLEGQLECQFSSVPQLCLTLCNPMDCSMPGFPVHHQFLDLACFMSVKSVMPSNQLILVPFSSCLQFFQHQGLF